MKKSQPSLDLWAHKFTTPTYMKFVPKEDFQLPDQTKQSMFSRVRNYFSPPKTTPVSPRSNIRQPTQTKGPVATLRYLKQLSNEDVLVGNEDQLDAIWIGGVVHDFVDTQFRWSINLGRAILHIAVDVRKSHIIVLPQKEIVLFRYNGRALAQPPIRLCSVAVPQRVRFVQMLPEGYILLCFSSGVSIYQIQDISKTLKLIYNKQFQIAPGLTLLQVPQPYENIVNIFFQQRLHNKEYISLWMLTMEFNPRDVKMIKPSKIYDIVSQNRSSVRFSNYSKDIYLINLAGKIFAMKHSYLLDSVEVNNKDVETHIRNIVKKVIVHVSEPKADVYKLEVNEEMNPPKIVLKSLDSVEIPKFRMVMKFVDAISILNDNFVLLFQANQDKHPSLKGQIKYAFIVSKRVRRQDKIVSTLPKTIKDTHISQIQEKADMAGKMGLERREIYLRLWNNSQKDGVEDFSILLDTYDYPTIKAEIQKKLKQHSMNFREVVLLQQGCLAMLQKVVFGPKPTIEHLKNYLISRFFLQKLQLYKQFMGIDRANGKAVLEDDKGRSSINIQSYTFFKSSGVRIHIQQLITEYINDDKDEIAKIRWLFKIFRFPLRTVYLEILKTIIKTSKNKLIKIIKAIPELLPRDLSAHEDELLEGIWDDHHVKWDTGCYSDRVETIENRDLLEQLCQSVWFKRHWLSEHDFSDMRRPQIQKIHHVNKSQQAFYIALEVIFQCINEQDILKEVVDHLQDNYPRLPEHIYGKIHLYHSLFEHFQIHKGVEDPQGEAINRFSEFLRLKDFDIFKAMFNYEKQLRKGFIIRQMKPLFYKLSGPQVFHEGLLNYFASQQSQISDIKYLLNRMNNEKKEFHEENESIYQVIVRAMQLKLRIGSPRDVPIEEVIIYIESIPLSQNNPVLNDLEIIRIINQEAQRFRKIRLNMSIFEITKNPDRVLAAVAQHSIRQRQVSSMRDIQLIKGISYQILADIQVLNAKIFADKEPQIIVFTYLATLLQEKELIGAVKALTGDGWINKHFSIDTGLLQNLVLYMYKFMLTRNNSYTANKEYLKELVTLVPEDSLCRVYIISELAIAEILSTASKPVRYPLSKSSRYFSTIQLQRLIVQLPGTQLIHIDIDTLFHHIQTVQCLSSNGQFSDIKKDMIIEMIIQRLIQEEMLKQALTRIKELLVLKQGRYLVIYPAVLALKLCAQLIDQNRLLLLTCLEYLVFQIEELINLLQQIMGRTDTNAERQQFLTLKLIYFKQKFQPYSNNNPILQTRFLPLLNSESSKTNYFSLFKLMFAKLKIHNQQFRRPQYHFIFALLCSDPYILIRYIFNIKYTINWKCFRAFISHFSQQEMFDKGRTVQFGKRVFAVVYQSIKNNQYIQTVIEASRTIHIDIDYDVDHLAVPQNQLEIRLKKGVDRMKGKLNFTRSPRSRVRESKEEFMEKITKMVECPAPKEGFLQYTYLDSDDNNKSPQKTLKIEEVVQQSHLTEFDSQFQRNFLMSRKEKEIGSYVSFLREQEQKSQFYKNKKAQEYIFSSLSLDRRRELEQAKGTKLSDRLRNSMRISRREQEQKMGLSSTPKNQPFSTSHLLFPSELPLSGQLDQEAVLKPESKANSEHQEIKKSRSIKLNSKSSHLREQRVIEEPIKIEGDRVGEDVKVRVQSEIHQRSQGVPLKREDSEPVLTMQMQDELYKQENMYEVTEKLMLKIDNDSVAHLNTAIFDQYSDRSFFEPLIMNIIEICFNDQTIGFKQCVLLTLKLAERFKLSLVNRKYLQIYVRVDGLQQKFNLSLPLKSIFPLSGLLLRQQRQQFLFQAVLPNILGNLNEQQMFKMCKVVTLAFKKSDLQQEILFNYLLKLFEELQKLVGKGSQSKERQMQLQKIGAVTDKIPIKYLKKKDTELIRLVKKQKIKGEVVRTLVASCQKRQDQDSMSYFEGLLSKQK